MIESSAIYLVSPSSIKDAKAYLMIRTRENAYGSHPEHRSKSQAERSALYDALKEKIRTEGFDTAHPITIQILRKDGKRDKIKDGHHRFAIALELGLPFVPVRFLFDGIPNQR